MAIGSTVGRIDESTPTDEFIAWTIERFRNRRLVITTSFGMEGCALIDMFAAQGAAPTVVYLDTMFFFPETYALRDRMVRRYPLITFVNRGTSLTPEAQAARHGPELWRRDPDLCCQLRRVEPMARALAGADVWVTAITRSQADSRKKTPLVAWDWQYQVLKLCPLIGWDRARIWDYVREHDVPYNELHERGYPTLGCTHCTLPVPGSSPSDYSREGRWAGMEKTECGMHWTDESEESTPISSSRGSPSTSLRAGYATEGPIRQPSDALARSLAEPVLSAAKGRDEERI